jgi:ribosome biogenesis protein BRX1
MFPTIISHLNIYLHLLTSTTHTHKRTSPTIQIWVRNYQILEQSATTAKEAHNQRKLTGQSSTTSLIEIGPRFVLNPIRIFRGSFGGQTLYVNDEFVNPNVVRAMEKKEQGERYVKRKGAERKRVRYGEELKRSVPVDPLGDVFK